MKIFRHIYFALFISSTAFTQIIYAQDFDLMITSGKIIDGSGNNWYYGNIGVRDGKIAAIGKLDGLSGKKIIDAKGKFVVPGFIDVHTHIEGDQFTNPEAANFIYDGVTTVITGNCGSSVTDIKKFYREVDSTQMAVNVRSLIGHNSVRHEIMGDAMRTPTAEEQRKMEQLVQEAMEAGAVGLSTGLIYVPGTYAETEEIAGMAQMASKYGGVYASHIRNEGDFVTKAINEAVLIGKLANIPVQISHFKVTYKPNHGRSVYTIAQVEAARNEGIDVTIDQYPYIASSTTLDQTLPSWAFGGGRDSLKYRLKNPIIRKKIKTEMLESLRKNQLSNFSYAVVAYYPPDTTLNGLSITQVNRKLGRKSNSSEEAETIMEMVGSANRTQMVFFSMDESDLERIMKYPYNMIASDAGVIAPGQGVPHPRAYGTNARVLGQYVRDKKIITLEEAIRRMTSLPAQKFQLNDRGLIRTGYAADLVILDAAQVTDQATFSSPHQYSKGIPFVIVNGVTTVEAGSHTGKHGGKALPYRNIN
jgi:N-acyl-D-amino-acid deacylase